MLLELVPTALLGLVTLAAGSALLDGWGAPTPGERLVLAWALGAMVLGTLSLLVGLWRFDRLTLGALDVGLLIVGARPLGRLARSLSASTPTALRELGATWAGRLVLAGLLGFATLDILGAATVVTDGDALRYHLATPRHWLRLGAVSNTPGIPYASFPMLVQIIYGHALAWGLTATPALLHTAWALIVTIGVYTWARRDWDAGVAALAALLLLSLTDLSAEAKLPRIDVAVALYGWGAATCWLRWRACGERGWLVCAAALAGAAAASKYTGLIVALVTGLLLGYDWMRHRARFGMLVVYSALAALVAAPWYLKTWLFTGTPVFPFGTTLFSGPLPPDVSAQIVAQISDYAPIRRTALNFILSPLLLTVHNQLFASGRIGPLWLLFLPLWACYRPKPEWARGAFAWGLLFAPLWFWISPLVRFAFPALALWAPVLAAVIARYARRPAWSRALVGGATVLWIGFAALSSVKNTIAQIPIALGLRTTQATLEAIPRLDGAYSYADLRRAAAVDGPLVVFDTAAFYIDRPLTLAGDLGRDPAAALDARYGGAQCRPVYILLPDKVAAQPDAWVAEPVRAWMARHAVQTSYRRGDVALYRANGCAWPGVLRSIATKTPRRLKGFQASRLRVFVAS